MKQEYTQNTYMEINISMRFIIDLIFRLRTFLLISGIIFWVTGCKKDDSKPMAKASFEYIENSSYGISDTIMLKNTSENSTKFQWFFGDGDTSSAKEPNHIYYMWGPFTIKLVASNDYSTDSIFKTVSINKICMKRIYTDPNKQLVNDSVFSIIKDLFSKNSLSIQNLQFYEYTKGNFTNIKCNTFNKGLEVLFSTQIFKFDKNGNFLDRTGEVDIPASLDTIPNYPLDSASRFLVADFLNDYLMVSASVNLDTACVYANLGYWDILAGTGSSTHQYTLAWKMTFNNREYPLEIVDAQTNKHIYYDNGVRIEK
jgi:PKD repeat protein